jgi:hypothetical protein
MIDRGKDAVRPTLGWNSVDRGKALGFGWEESGAGSHRPRAAEAVRHAEVRASLVRIVAVRGLHGRCGRGHRGVAPNVCGDIECDDDKEEARNASQNERESPHGIATPTTSHPVGSIAEAAWTARQVLLVGRPADLAGQVAV